MDYVIIPKPNFSRREGINSRCRRFDLLLFHLFGSICYRNNCRCHHSDGSLAINRDGSYWRRWLIQLNTRAATWFRNSFWVFSLIKNLLVRNEMQTREEGPTVDTNSLTYLLRRSSKNCDLQFANSDRQI